MKILFYSWAPYKDEAKRGGGAASYVDRTIAALAAGGQHDIAHLSSGTEYEPGRSAPYYRVLPPGGSVARFTIVNSPVLAPAHMNATNTAAAVNDTLTRDVLARLIDKEGPFDVIHFNNFEGISFRCLQIKDHFPTIRLVVSLHDYYPFCPQVKLWKNDSATCDDANGGKDCVNCPATRASSDALKVLRKLLSPARRLGLINARTEQRFALGAALYLLPPLSRKVRNVSRRGGRSPGNSVSSAEAQRQAEDNGQFLQGTTELLNTYADRVLAVSNRVRTIAISHGVTPEKVVTDYIGTRFEISASPPPRPREDDTICIAYLGYASREKGFFFLLECLQSLPQDLADKIHLVIAARGEGNWISARTKQIGERFLSYQFQNGYSPDELPGLLEQVHVGLVPVLWEDNLPQVALEFAGHGIPVITSDLGGAQEIGSHCDFVFAAGNAKEFIACLRRIQGNYPQLREEFFSSLQKPPTVPEHIAMLLHHYGTDEPATTGS